MKHLSFRYSLDGGCLLNASGVTQSLPRYGVDGICLYNTIDKNFNPVTNAETIRNVAQGQNGTLNVMISIDSSLYEEMSGAKRLSLPAKYQNACSYINRFPPVNLQKYSDTLKYFFDELGKKKMLPFISIQLGQEIDSQKYLHASFQDGIDLLYFKYNVLKGYGLDMYVANFTSGKKNADYNNWIETDPIFDDPKVHYSTSWYPESKGILQAVDYPKRNPKGAITAFSIGVSTNKSRINSSMYMVRLVQTLQEIYNKPIDFLYFWKIVECENESGDRMYAAWEHIKGGGWRTNPVWKMQLQLIDVVKGGYEVTATGIRGASGKEIILTETNYTIK
jgi:hypothetical protein